MSKSLTIQQFAAIALGQSQPPWHLGSLCALYGQQPISLKKSIAALSTAVAVVFVNVSSNYNNYLYFDQSGALVANPDSVIETYWYWSAPSQADLATLATALKPNGCSISYLSPGPSEEDTETATSAVVLGSNIVGITGTFADLASLNITAVPGSPSKWTAADITVVKNASFLFNNLAGLAWDSSPAGKASANGLLGNPAPQALGALSAGVSTGNSSTGLLGTVGINAGINAAQLFVTHFRKSRDIIRKLILNLNAEPVTEGLDDAIATISDWEDWINYLQTVTISIPTSAVNMTLNTGAFLTISAINFQIEGSPGGTFTDSEYILNADGTSTGGVIS
jgi:hypothetical protein